MKIRKQRGLTLIGFLFALAFGLLIVYTGMRVIPMYLEYHAVVSALDTLKSTPGASSLSPQRMRNNLINTMWVNYASRNVGRQHIRIKRETTGVVVTVAYEARRPWIGNLDIVGKFNRSVTLP